MSVLAEFEKEMGYTREEFLRHLPVAFGDGNCEIVDGDRAVVRFETGRVTITLGETRRRRLASLSLPFMNVHFRIDGLDEDQRRRFHEDFQRSYQKGGG